MYEPKPIDTSGITLSPELSALTERLAENAHDIWAQQRLAEGGTMGRTAMISATHKVRLCNGSAFASHGTRSANKPYGHSIEPES